MKLNDVLQKHTGRIRRFCWPVTTFIVPQPEGFLGPQGQLVSLTPEDVMASDWCAQSSDLPEHYYLIFARASKIIVGGAMSLYEAKQFQAKEPVDIYQFKRGELCP